MGVRGTVELFPEYAEGLQDLDGFSRIILIYAFRRCTDYSLLVTQFLDPEPHGVFATRALKRPNAIGLSVVRLVAIHGITLEIEDAGMLDGTPVLDIKPYVPVFDAYAGSKAGWFDSASDAAFVRSDERFR